ncbi:alpha/beta fold hydrolase [Mycobacterium sp. THU-M104]|uniref:alpha/beta fold hydrolase n=1 Tax=Mycobacterium sp. THU-M104 TaxID=3410515 RepID=UPI003BA00C20
MARASIDTPPPNPSSRRSPARTRPTPDTASGSPTSVTKLSHGLPTLLVWGEQDRIIPVADGYAAHDAVPGSRIEVLPGIGHFPHVESPTAVVDILDDFIVTTARDRELTNRKT